MYSLSSLLHPTNQSKFPGFCPYSMHSFSQLIPLSHSTNCSSSIQEASSWLLLLHTINIWRRKGLDSVDKHCCISSDQQAPSFWKKCLVDSSSSFPVHLSKALASFLIWSTAYGCHPLNVSAGRDMKVVYFVWFQMWSGQLFSCVLMSKLRDSWYKKLVIKDDLDGVFLDFPMSQWFCLYVQALRMINRTKYQPIKG